MADYVKLKEDLNKNFKEMDINPYEKMAEAISDINMVLLNKAYIGIREELRKEGYKQHEIQGFLKLSVENV